jgi:hypothetical protein
MKASVLLNVLNHVPGDATWDGADTITMPDGSAVSIAASAATMTPGESQLLPPEEPGKAGGSAITPG